MDDADLGLLNAFGVYLPFAVWIPR
jgi:hypothetical protein